MWNKLLNINDKHRSKLLIVLFIIGFLAIHFTGSAHATLSSCSVNLTPQSVAPSSDNGFTFGFFNSSDNPIQWVKITRPTGSYLTVESGSANGWLSNNTGNDATFTTGSLAHGTSQGFVVQALASSQTAPAINWSVLVSDSPIGADPITCDGDLSMSIAIPPSVINISNVGASNVSSGGITITWDTDVASTSQVSYGLDGGYGSSSNLDSSLIASHSVNLTGLTANTGYHFQVVSTTPDGGTASSGDSTFLTAVESVVVTKTVTVTLPPVLIVPVTSPGDKIPPTIAITSALPNVVQVMPAIIGTASDNVSVARLEYSTDGGQNWLPVDSAPKLGGKQVAFSFTPTHLDDGSYVIMARAIDAGGNITTTPAIDVVVDRLPPIVGGILVSSGPQVLTPDSSGIINTVVGIDQKITMSAVGGPTTISLIAQKIGAKASAPQIFNLTESSDTGLWSGIVSFTSAGRYSLTSDAIDGAGNKTSQLVSTINVASDPHTYSQSTGKPVQSQVTLYYLETDSKRWVVWDGSGYSQNNPQITDSHGNFKLFLPPGKYYLKATADNYRTLISSIFETTVSMPLTTDLALRPTYQLRIGPLHLSMPSLAIQKINLSSKVSSLASSVSSNLIGKPLPDFTLSDTSGKIVHATDLLGRPTVITFGTTWSSTMSEQLATLNIMQTNKDLNVIPIALQQGSGQVRAYTVIAGLGLNWLVDPDSTLTPSFGSPSLPTHYFIDRSGIIKQVIVGLLTQKQIEDTLGSL